MHEDYFHEYNYTAEFSQEIFTLSLLNENYFTQKFLAPRHKKVNYGTS